MRAYTIPKELGGAIENIESIIIYRDAVWITTRDSDLKIIILDGEKAISVRDDKAKKEAQDND